MATAVIREWPRVLERVIRDRITQLMVKNNKRRGQIRLIGKRLICEGFQREANICFIPVASLSLFSLIIGVLKI